VFQPVISGGLEIRTYLGVDFRRVCLLDYPCGAARQLGGRQGRGQGNPERTAAAAADQQPLSGKGKRAVDTRQQPRIQFCPGCAMVRAEKDSVLGADGNALRRSGVNDDVRRIAFVHWDPCFTAIVGPVKAAPRYGDIEAARLA